MKCLSICVRAWMRVRDLSGVQSFAVPADCCSGEVSGYPGMLEIGGRGSSLTLHISRSCEWLYSSMVREKTPERCEDVCSILIGNKKC